MGRKSKYIEILESETREIERKKKGLESYAISKKLNKSTNLELLNLLLSDPTYKEHIRSSLYRSNSNYDSWVSIARTYNPNDTRLKKSYQYLEKILTISDTFLNFSDAFSVLIHTIDYEEYFLRSIDTWTPKTRNPQQQGLSLIRHLFVKYPTPSFLEKYFTTGFIEGIVLYIHMGAGKSLKNYPDYPPNMIIHNKAAHHLYSTPHDLTFFVALRRIQVLYMGGDDYIFSNLMRSNILREQLPIIRNLNRVVKTDREEFWLTVMKFFIDNTMIEPTKISEIIDYINNVKYCEQRVYDENGLGRNVDPPQPGFSMKGRNPATLIDLSDEWHEQIARANRMNRIGRGRYKSVPVENYTWLGINLNDGEFKKGKDRTYRVIQICSFFNLKDEGRYMHHCVASYASSCSSGKCAIFSVRLFISGMYFDTGATIEVRNNQVVQIRGKYNRKPDDTTISVIKEWANREYIGISSYAL